ncbi:PP2C family serine/threonine-protein phosphatase [Megamonas hypermegale]|uniref:PP2C family serine/threonine-protein phosphatase n=1 Tax=Megamonas hypermegale TaxID=158847 RepID=UPI0026EFCF2C|nr:PP2C family serine/threonine-protein phosphatase [Megamonas hypermegale]
MGYVIMWHMLDYAQAGRSHCRKNIPCQDKTVSCCMNGVHLLGLADGAGSAKFSHFGAETALQATCDYIANNFERIFNETDGVQVKKNILTRILEALRQKAEQLNCSIKDLASTLLFVAIKNNRFLLFHIGDGVIGYWKNDSLKVASKPETGEFSNTTVFTTSSKALLYMKLFKGNIENIHGFVLISDGAAESFYQKRTGQLAPVIVRIMRKVCLVEHGEMLQLLKDSFQLVVNNTQDDCSIAIIAQYNEELERFLSMNFWQQMRYFNMNNKRRAKKKYSLWMKIIKYLNEPKTVQQTAQCVYLKKKYLRKQLFLMAKMQLVKKMNNKFHLR